MKVTFDTNTYEPIVEYERVSNDPSALHYKAIHDAIKAGKIQPFVCEALFTLESVMRKDRAAFIAKRRPSIEIKENETNKENKIRATVTLTPDHDQHPGLEERDAERLKKALKIGFRLLAQPRIGMPRPEQIQFERHSNRFAPDADIKKRQEIFANVCRKIEDRGVGFARAWELGNRARKRAGSASLPWFKLLTDDQYFNDDERKELAAAVGEWVDGDNIAAHISYGNDIFCTHDKASKKNRPSILNKDNRKWLSDEYSVRVCTVQDLVALL